MINENTPTAFVLKLPVVELELDTHQNLNTRVMNCFWCAKIETIGDLVQKSEKDLLKIKHFGRTALNQVKKRLSELDLKLREKTIEAVYKVDHRMVFNKGKNYKWRDMTSKHILYARTHHHSHWQDNLTLEEYHLLPPLSAHFLMDVAANNCSKAVHNQKYPKKPTKAMVNGTLIHTGIELREDLTRDIGEYYVQEPPDINKRTNAGKQELAEFHKSIGDKIVITEDQWEMSVGCMEAAWSHLYARPYLKAAKFERSGFTTINGVDVKARPDLDCYEHQRTLVDIKTRQKDKSDVESWLKDWWYYGTYIQAGLQLLVWEKLNMPCDHYYYLLQEVEEPYDTNLVYLDDELMEISREKTLDAIEKWKSWLGAGSPKGYGKPQQLSAKPWMRNHELTL